MKKVWITGITGQDGAYLARFLLDKSYKVHGLKRRSSLFNTQRIDGIYQGVHVTNKRFFLHYGDLTDSTKIIRLVQKIRPDEIYNLGAQSHVQVSFEAPEYTADVDALGTLRVLEAVRLLGLEKPVSIRRPPPNCTALSGKCRKRKPRLSTPVPPMPTPNFTATESRSTTAKPTACMTATGFCSTTNPPCAGRPL